MIGFALLLRDSSVRGLKGDSLILEKNKVVFYIEKEKWKTKTRPMEVGGELGRAVKRFVGSGIIELGHPGRLFELCPDPNKTLKWCLKQLKVKPPPRCSYSFHSLRIGGATALGRQTCPVDKQTLKAWGNWKSSSAMEKYFRFDSKAGSRDKHFWDYLVPSSEWP